MDARNVTLSTARDLLRKATYLVLHAAGRAARIAVFAGVLGASFLATDPGQDVTDGIRDGLKWQQARPPPGGEVSGRDVWRAVGAHSRVAQRRLGFDPADLVAILGVDGAETKSILARAPLDRVPRYEWWRAMRKGAWLRAFMEDLAIRSSLPYEEAKRARASNVLTNKGIAAHAAFFESRGAGLPAWCYVASDPLSLPDKTALATPLLGFERSNRVGVLDHELAHCWESAYFLTQEDPPYLQPRMDELFADVFRALHSVAITGNLDNARYQVLAQRQLLGNDEEHFTAPALEGILAEIDPQELQGLSEAVLIRCTEKILESAGLERLDGIMNHGLRLDSLYRKAVDDGSVDHDSLSHAGIWQLRAYHQRLTALYAQHLYYHTGDAVPAREALRSWLRETNEAFPLAPEVFVRAMAADTMEEIAEVAGVGLDVSARERAAANEAAFGAYLQGWDADVRSELAKERDLRSGTAPAGGGVPRPPGRGSTAIAATSPSEEAAASFAARVRAAKAEQARETEAHPAVE